MFRATLMNALFALAIATTSAHADLTPASVPEDHHRLDELYMIQPHNSYEHGSALTRWLDAGYRSLEIDVLDTGSWAVHPRGPYASHESPPSDNNCRGSLDRLADCLDDIMDWQDRNPGELPITVFVDMKTTRALSRKNWEPAEIVALDTFIGQHLGPRLYRYSDLRSHIAAAAGTPREQLRATGWPTVGELRDRIVVGMTGGQVKDVNGRMALAAWSLGDSMNTFLCPDVDASDPDEISGETDAMGWISARIFCANLKIGDHYQRVVNRSAQYRQLIHTWGAKGYAIDFHSKSFEANYIAIAHGASAIGVHVDEPLTEANVFVPAWTDTLPLTGVRRSVPGYFAMKPRNAWGSRCVGIQSNRYRDGSDIEQETCSFATDQQFVYTAEGQLRPRGDNQYCVDIEKGSAADGRDMHLWDCDGGDSEKWSIRPDGSFRNFSSKGTAYCAGIPNSSTVSGLQLELDQCADAPSMTFELVPVNDWTQTSF